MIAASGSRNRSAGTSFGRIVLVRRAPTAEDLARIRALLEEAAHESMIFLQGEGVTLASSDGLPASLLDAAQWRVCVGSWRRRYSDEPDAPFRLSSLTEWLDALLPIGGDSPELVCFGRDGGSGRDSGHVA